MPSPGALSNFLNVRPISHYVTELRELPGEQLGFQFALPFDQLSIFARRMSDAFHQASTALRELHSTVVVQGEQAERVSAQTRVVANYNHSHALTMLYYEVLQHHRVVTRPASRRPALLLRQPLSDFTVGGTVGIAEGKETVKLNVRGTYGIHSDTQNLVQGADGYTEEVSFKGRKLTASAPSIKPLI